MLSSTRDIAPSCIENVEELIERQEKSLTQLETKRSIVQDLITKGKQLMENPDKPKFLDGHVGRIKEGWDETKNKASARLELLYNTKAAWEGYASGLETIVAESRKDGMKPRTRPLLVWSFCTTPRLPGKAMLLDSRPLSLNLRRVRRRSRRSRSALISMLPRTIWPRGKKSLTTPRTPLRECLVTSNTITMS